MKIKLLTLIIFTGVLSSLNSNAQVTQPARYERPHKNRDHEFIVISMKENGIALVRDTEKYEAGKRKWEVIFLDSTLHETWETIVLVEQRMNILGHEHQGDNIYLIFQEPDVNSRTVYLVELDTKTQLKKEHTFKPEVSIKFSHFLVMNNKAIFGGTIQKEPALLMYDLPSETNKIIPGIVEPGLELMDLRNNVNETFNAILVESRSSKNKKLIVRTYDLSGVMLVEDIINIDEDKTILDATASTLLHDELLITGTWTYGFNKSSAGIFSVIVDPFNEQAVNYYNFTDLNHFLDYLKPKRAKRIIEKAKYRKSIGKPVEFRASLTSIKVEETKDGFSFLGETYEIHNNSPRYSSPYGYNPIYYNPYGYYPMGFTTIPYRYYTPYNSPYSNYNYTNDIRAISSSIVFFDKKGKMVSDYSMKFPEIKLYAKEQVSDFAIEKDTLVILCKSEKGIHLKYCDDSGATLKESKITATPNENQIIRSENQDNSGVRKWYDNLFYVYGYQSLRTTEKKNHDVFYITKIRIN